MSELKSLTENKEKLTNELEKITLKKLDVENEIKKLENEIKKFCACIQPSLSALSLESEEIKSKIDKIDKDIVDLKLRENWKEFYAGIRKGWLWLDPWGGDDCIFHERLDDQLIRVKIVYSSSTPSEYVTLKRINEFEYEPVAGFGYFSFQL